MLSRLRGALASVWHWSYQAPDTLSEAVQRQARLVAGVSLALLLLLSGSGILLLIIAPFNSWPILREAYVILGGIPIVLAALIMNRRGHFQAAAGLLLFVFTVGPGLSAFVNVRIYSGGRHTPVSLCI